MPDHSLPASPDDEPAAAEGLDQAARALVHFGMSVQQARVALAAIAPKGQEAAFGLTMEYLAWRAARGLNPSAQFERLVKSFAEQAATSEGFPGFWSFEAYRG
jgi:hypothetical protein